MTFFLLFSCLRLFAASDAEFDQLVTQLGDDEYEVRIRAESALSHYEGSYIPKMLKVLETSDDPEVVHRMGKVAKQAYINSVLPYEEAWLKHKGYTGLNISLPTPTQTETPDGLTESVPGFFVSWVDNDGPAKAVKEFDLITAVDGVDVHKAFKYNDRYARDKIFNMVDSPSDYVPRVKPGTDIKLTIKRIKTELLKEFNWNETMLAESKYYDDSTKFDLVTVTITTTEKPRWWMNEDMVHGLEDKYWNQYLDKYRETKNKP